MFTLTSMLTRTARLHAARPTIIDAENSLNWTQFVNRISRAASVLQSKGVHRGDRYGVIALNSLRYSELICAGYWMGAVPVPNNHLSLIHIRRCRRRSRWLGRGVGRLK